MRKEPGRASVAEQGVRGPPGGSPDAREAPGLRQPLELRGVGHARDERDVEQVAQRRQGVVAPGVGGHHESVRCRGQHENAVAQVRGRHAELEELVNRGRLEAVDPLRFVMQLHEQRQSRRPERPEVVDALVDPGLAAQLEARIEQLPLRALRVGHDEIEVAVGAKRGIRVMPRHLGALHEEHRPVERGAHLGHQHRGRHGARRRHPLCRDHPRRDVEPERAPAPCRDQQEAVVLQVVERGGAVEQLVEPPEDGVDVGVRGQ